MFQIPCKNVTTIENVLRACASEFFGITPEKYEEEITMKNIEVFLLDGKARIQDPAFTFNRVTFNFVYLKVHNILFIRK